MTLYQKINYMGAMLVRAFKRTVSLHWETFKSDGGLYAIRYDIVTQARLYGAKGESLRMLLLTLKSVLRIHGGPRMDYRYYRSWQVLENYLVYGWLLPDDYEVLKAYSDNPTVETINAYLVHCDDISLLDVKMRLEYEYDPEVKRQFHDIAYITKMTDTVPASQPHYTENL